MRDQVEIYIVHEYRCGVQNINTKYLYKEQLIKKIGGPIEFKPPLLKVRNNGIHRVFIKQFFTYH